MFKFEVTQNLKDNCLAKWDELLTNSRNPLPFQKYKWVSNWWSTFSTPRDKLFIILAYKDDALIGLAPLMYRFKVHPCYAVLRFIGRGYFDYFDFIIKEGEEGEVIHGFFRLINKEFGRFELELKNIFEGSETFKIFRQQPALNRLIFFEDIAPHIELPVEKEKFYYRVKGTLRWDISRRERRLKELGDLQFGSCNDIEEAREALEDFFSLHIRKWESGNAYSAFKFIKMRQFMRGMLEAFFPEKIMNLFYLLHNNQKKVAICPGFEMADRFIFYTHTYDPDFARCSPGKILINKLINYSISHKYHEFDFGIGKEPYKLEWPYEIREIYNIYIYTNKCTVVNIFLKLRRYIISNYFLNILPNLRKFHLAVYLWRWFNRKRGQYKRFQ